MNTWKTPQLKQYPTSSSRHPTLAGSYYVSREHKTQTVCGKEAFREYLRKDGTWWRSMDINNNSDTGGTYFKTLEEVINVLCEFEINVVGEEQNNEDQD